MSLSLLPHRPISRPPVISENAITVQDGDHKIFFVLPPQPASGWDDTARASVDAVSRLQKSLPSGAIKRNGRRGSFSTSIAGFGYGGGQDVSTCHDFTCHALTPTDQVPKDYSMSQEARKAWNTFLTSTAMQSVAKHAQSE